jgi:ABC-type iron transport system FetAB ATPase subunit
VDPVPKKPTSAEPEPLRLEDVSVGALEGVSLCIAPGEIVCLSGASGSGKSRLLRAIADLDPHGGRIWLGEEEQSGISAHCWRGWVMMVPSESQWWADTVGEHFDGIAPGGLAALGFEDGALSWPVNRLSSGEKQRLALLRAVARDPRALLLDEPTAHLDDGTARRTERWLCDLTRNRSLPVLWVAHDSDQIGRVADRHYRIDGAGLEEDACR